MDWYPWYYTIYELDTMHLNPYQDGCYRRLIDHYMKTRAPLPDNDAALARIIGDSLDNWTALAATEIRKFFTPKNGHLHLRRCDDVLTYQDAKTKKLSESGKKGAKIRHTQAIENNDVSSHPKATLKPPLRVAVAQVQVQVQEQEEIPPLPPKGDLVKFTNPVWLPEEAWREYCKHRGKKFTDGAKRLAMAKLERWHSEGHDITEILNNSVMNGWKGLFEPKEKTNARKSRNDAMEEACDRALAELYQQERSDQEPDYPELQGF